jgi:hypothetical protein
VRQSALLPVAWVRLPRRVTVFSLTILMQGVLLCPGAAAAPFIRGDTDHSGSLQLTDAVRIFGFLFLGGASGTCLDAFDADDRDRINITDGIYVLNHLFLGGPPPAPPFPACGEDPTPNDGISCDSHRACSEPPRDTIAPVIEITSPANLLVVGSAGLEVTGTVSDESDALDALDVTVNSVPVTPDPRTGEFRAMVRLGEGQNAVSAVAIDPAGNSAVATISIFLDIAPPTIVVDHPAALPDRGPEESDLVINEARVTITGYLNDPGSSQVGGEVGAVFVRSTTPNGAEIVRELEARLSGRAFVALDFPLRRGINVIEVTGRDGVGNQAAPVVRRVTYTDIAGQRIVRVSGDGQSAPILARLPAPLVVQLVDPDGRAVPGRNVRFNVVRNSGLLSATPGPGPRVRELFVRTDSNGQAAAWLTLGDRVGAGFNRVSATAAGFQGEVLFCATARPGTPTQLMAIAGTNQRGSPGLPLSRPLIVLAVDEEGNPIPDLPVTFEVVAGGGGLTRGGKSGLGAGAGAGAALVVETNDEGLASAVFHLGALEGINAHRALARFEGLPGLQASFIASAIAPREASATAVAGVLLDNSDLPLEGVTAQILDTDLSARTDAEGFFRLDGAPVGTVRLLIDGSTSTRAGRWPSLQYEMTTIAGIDNSIGEPIRLPEVDVASEQLAGGDQAVVIEMAGVPGMSLTVFPRSVTFPDGSRTGRLSLTQVKLDKVPMPPPNGSLFMPPAWTIQPSGTTFDPPARVSIPNDGLPPGRVIDIFQFDHVLEQFVNVGTGTVVPDGSVILSDPGFGIARAGWGGCGQPPPPRTCVGGCDDGNPCTDDACSNGTCMHTPITRAKMVSNGCRGCNNGVEDPPKTDAQCCATEAFAGGFVVCCNGQKLACAGSSFDGTSKQAMILRACALAHEHAHFPHVDCPTGANECDTTRPPFKDGQDPGEGECEGSKAEVSCLQSMRGDCGGNAACEAEVDGRIAQIKSYGNSNMAGCFP